MGCGNAKVVEEEDHNKKEQNANSVLNLNENENNKSKINENINNDNCNIENININDNSSNNDIENYDENQLLKNKINKKKEKKVKTIKKIESANSKTKLSIKENELKNDFNTFTKLSFRDTGKNKYYEEYNEANDIGEEEKEETEEEKRQKESEERKDFLVKLKFQNIFKKDNIDKNNSSILSDITQKVRITFIPSQQNFPKVVKYFDPVQGEKGPFWQINLEASRNEKMCPLWIEKGKEVIFYISGKWKINDELECDCNGIPEPKNNYEKYMPNYIKYKFNKGALIGRVIFGEKFQVYDGLRYKSDCDGPLILKMNLNSVWGKEKPSGELNIKIKGAIHVDNIYELEERIGWRKQLKKIELNNIADLPEYKIPSLEKMIIILFNKARYNSKLFAYQYLDNMKDLTPNSTKIYNEFINNKNQNLPFKINVSIVKFLQNFYSPFLSENNGGGGGDKNKNNDSLIILKTNKIIKNYLNKCFSDKKNIFQISIIKYKDKNPFHLASRLIFENEIRENIFNSRCEEMSMMTVQTNEGFKKNCFYTIIVLSNENGNNNINYDISKNVKNFIDEEQKKSNDNIISYVKINLNPLPNIFSSQKNSNFYDFK